LVAGWIRIYVLINICGLPRPGLEVITILRIFGAAFFVFASIFCFASFIPYTFLFLVKNPPYPWLFWFASHGPLLYWCALATVVITVWKHRNSSVVGGALVLQAVIGLVFSYKNVLVNLENDWSAYVWGVVLLLPTLIANVRCFLAEAPDKPSAERGTLLSYSNSIAVAILAALLSVCGALFRQYGETKTLALNLKDRELAIFAIAAFVWLAVVIVSVLNAVQLLLAKYTGRPNVARRWSLYALLFAAVDISVVRFMVDALSVRGWYVQLYGAVLSLCVASWIFAILPPLIARVKESGRGDKVFLQRFSMFLILLCLSIAAIAVPNWIGNSDWNGLLEGSFNLFLLISLSACMAALRTRGREYSVPLMTAVFLVSGCLYWTINASGFLWAKDLGTTDSDIAVSLEAYRGRNVSYGMLESVFGRGNQESCGESCLTLRQFTNIRNARAKTPLRLVDQLIPNQRPRPNIFIFVIDSLRQDYLGAYNRSVDFTPNIDALSRDSVVMRNAFTQYAGTSLSEPAIWSGAELLHAHYMRPFENVNSLLTLGKTDGYEIIVSRDHILGKLLSPEDDVVFLDTDKKFNEYEISSTLQQLEAHLVSRRDPQRPVMFYAQPMNIHVLGVNNLPERTESNWRHRSGFDDRVAFKLQQVDEFLGQFIAFLKARALYENSIIIVTADHGDAFPSALSGFGLVRRGHSEILFPEVMRVPLIIRLPAEMRRSIIYNENCLAALTDITPSLYYLLGHRPIKLNPVLGRPLFATSAEELHHYDRDHLLLASDVSATYGIVSGDGRSMYVTYDSPQRSLLFDLVFDHDGTTNYLTSALKTRYDRQILEDLRSIAAFYDYTPDGGSRGSFAWDK
jgi:hypothetical protein